MIVLSCLLRVQMNVFSGDVAPINCLMRDVVGLELPRFNHGASNGLGHTRFRGHDVCGSWHNLKSKPVMLYQSRTIHDAVGLDQTR